MRDIAKVMCLMLALLPLAVTAMASESSIVTQTRPITFHAERGIFLSAEIINPGTDNQILKVVLPDSTILYRDLSNNRAWKEQKANGRFLKSSTLTEEELNLLSGLNLDTGWFPPSFPIQVKFLLKVSMGKIVADLPGDVQLSYNEDEVQVGEQLDTWLKWVGDHGGGNLHMEGGIEFGGWWKVCVNLPWPIPDICDSGYIPKIPHVDFGFFRDCGFTPFLLDNALSCNANISSTRLPIPSIGWEDIAALYIGADVAGEVTGTLAGTSVCGNNAYCIYREGDEKYFPVQISNCQTSVGVENKYNSSFRLRWEISLTPTGCLDLFLLPDICFNPYTLDFTIFNQNLPLDFNRPNVQFQIEGQPPPPPPWVDANPGCGYIDVEWGAVSGATSYCIYRDGSRRTCVSGTSWRDSNPGNSTRCYRVTARNDCGESGKSSQDCAKAKFPPPPPSSVNCMPGCGYIDVSWSSVSTADQYCIYRDDQKMDSVTASTTSWRDNNPGSSQRCYTVASKNECPEGSQSSQSCCKATSIPQTPDTLFCTDPDYTVDTGQSYTIYWDLVEGASSYILYENDTLVDTISGDRDSITHSVPRSYYYSLKACNHCGCSDPSNLLWVIVTDVEEIPSLELPKAFVLQQNYPNPFNPETQIEFSLPRASFVTIDVFDVLGKRIRSLVSERLSAGYKMVTWDGTDNNGQSVASGVYFYRLEAGEVVETRKMVLLK